MSKSPYEVLGVQASATQEDIKNAYRNLAKKFHPDMNPGKKDAEKRFKEINAANEIIGDVKERAKFDRGEMDDNQEASARAAANSRSGPFYHQTQAGGGGRYSSAFGGMDDDDLRSFFSNMGARGSAPNPNQPGADAAYEMEISFKDAVLGAEKEITLQSGKRLSVKIPAGVADGAKLRFAGQGGLGIGNGTAGDAYVELRVSLSKLFKRDGFDLEMELPVSLAEAILGAEVKTPTIDGSVLLKIPPLVRSGQRLRVPGKGVPKGPNGERGDQFVLLSVSLPTEADPDFKQAVESWSKRQPAEPRQNWPGVKGDYL